MSSIYFDSFFMPFQMGAKMTTMVSCEGPVFSVFARILVRKWGIEQPDKGAYHRLLKQRQTSQLQRGEAMLVVLSHWSALQCWRVLRRCNSLSESYIVGAETSPIGGPRLKASAAELGRLREAYSLQGQLHVLVTKDSQRHQRANVTVHQWRHARNAPCFYELEPGVYAASPELCYLQLARELDFVDCVRLGYELCSSYVVNEHGSIVPSAPLMRVTGSRFLESYPHLAGRRALAALEHVLEGAASPKETELAIKLGLPRMRGGYGLRGFEMNPEVALGEFGRQITGKRSCRPDLLWAEKRVDVEYNGKDWHSFPEQRESDMRRRQALAGEGYTVLAVDQATLGSPAKMEELANEISLAVRGRRLPLSRERFFEANRELFARFAGQGSHVSPS